VCAAPRAQHALSASDTLLYARLQCHLLRWMRRVWQERVLLAPRAPSVAAAGRATPKGPEALVERRGDASAAHADASKPQRAGLLLLARRGSRQTASRQQPPARTRQTWTSAGAASLGVSVRRIKRRQRALRACRTAAEHGALSDTAAHSTSLLPRGQPAMVHVDVHGARSAPAVAAACCSSRCCPAPLALRPRRRKACAAAWLSAWRRHGVTFIPARCLCRRRRRGTAARVLRRFQESLPLDETFGLQ
jgi:hypothetical protein